MSSLLTSVPTSWGMYVQNVEYKYVCITFFSTQPLFWRVRILQSSVYQSRWSIPTVWRLWNFHVFFLVCVVKPIRTNFCAVYRLYKCILYTYMYILLHERVPLGFYVHMYILSLNQSFNFCDHIAFKIKLWHELSMQLHQAKLA